MSRCGGIHCPGCGDSGLPAGLIAGGVAVVAAAAFVLSHLLVIAIGLAVVGVGTAGAVLALMRLSRPEIAPADVRDRLIASRRAEMHSSAQRPAIASAHQHLHLHGLTAEDVAAIVAARPKES